MIHIKFIMAIITFTILVPPTVIMGMMFRFWEEVSAIPRGYKKLWKVIYG